MKKLPVTQWPSSQFVGRLSESAGLGNGGVRASALRHAVAGECARSDADRWVVGDAVTSPRG